MLRTQAFISVRVNIVPSDTLFDRRAMVVDALRPKTGSRRLWNQGKVGEILENFQDLFFKYSLNNFLHAQVEQCISHVFEWKPMKRPCSSETPPTAPTSPKTAANEEDEMETADESKPQEEKSEEAEKTEPYSNPLLEHVGFALG